MKKLKTKEKNKKLIELKSVWKIHSDFKKKHKRKLFKRSQIRKLKKMKYLK